MNDGFGVFFGMAPISGSRDIPESHRPPFANICVLLRRKITELNFGLSLLRHSSSRRAYVFPCYPPPAAPPYIIKSAGLERNSSCFGCGRIIIASPSFQFRFYCTFRVKNCVNNVLNHIFMNKCVLNLTLF